MNILIPLILAAAGVAVAYLLEERSEKGSTKIFTPQNWFGSASEGSWTEAKYSEILSWWFIAAILVFLWFFVNTKPPMKCAMSVYLFLSVITIGLSAGEFVKPELKWAAILTPNFRDGKALVVGLVGGFSLFALSHFMGAMMIIPHLKAVPLVAGVLLTGFMIPFVEETFVRGVICPTITEDFGIISGIIGSAAFFSFLHWMVYKAAFAPLLTAFVFGIFAGAVALEQRSILGPIVAHVVFNVLVLVLA